VITTFADQATEDVFKGVHSKQARRIPQQPWTAVRRKIDMLNAAHSPDDLKVPPRNRLEALKGSRKGFYSIRVNDQYRIVFRFENNNASEVKCEDYH
jgi:proteic killer suppression protein